MKKNTTLEEINAICHDVSLLSSIIPNIKDEDLMLKIAKIIRKQTEKIEIEKQN